MALIATSCPICQQIWRTQQWPQDWKMSVFIPIPKKGNAKKCSNCCKTALISHATKVMLKILQARPQQYMNHKLPDVQVGFKKTKDEHWGTRVSFNSGFLGVYAQQWDCWVVWQFYFQFFKESPHCL